MCYVHYSECDTYLSFESVNYFLFPITRDSRLNVTFDLAPSLFQNLSNPYNRGPCPEWWSRKTTRLHYSLKLLSFSYLPTYKALTRIRIGKIHLSLGCFPITSSTKCIPVSINILLIRHSRITLQAFLSDHDQFLLMLNGIHL